MNRSEHNQASITSTTRSDFSSRLGYVAYLGSVALCSVLAFMSLLLGRLELLLAALAAGGLMLGLRSFLRDSPALSEDEDFNEGGLHLAHGDCSEANSRPELVRLVSLLQEFDELERARGTADFDPWVLQTVRHEISEMLGDDPGLRRLLGLEH